MVTNRFRLPLLGLLCALSCLPAASQIITPVPPAERGTSNAERQGTHDANNIRTVFWNYGMVGDYPADPGNVNVAVFHSFEIPKGSGVNYSDGGTPFVLAKIMQTTGDTGWIMETGYRERQGFSPRYARVMRFEPRPAYIQADPGINVGRSPAVSNDPRTWPPIWPDKDASWNGDWDGYFGKRAAADEESFCVVDDDYYDAWAFTPDIRDTTRHGLGLRVEIRGFQWANPQASYVIFTHYDVTNEGTTSYPMPGQRENIMFGIYFDSGVGGEAFSCDGVYESDDDNAYFDRSTGINLTYTWDKYGHGIGLGTNCAPTGYLAYAYLETPGEPDDGKDNDDDGITDEKRDSGPGQLISYPGIDPNHPIPPTSADLIAKGQQAITTYINSSPAYNLQKFVAFYGPLANRPAYKRGYWWTGDENMDWDWMVDDVGQDGVPNTHDPGEGDFIPTAGESHFDQTDLNESDQIGLTGFKMNPITPGPYLNNIQFYHDQVQDWPRFLFNWWMGVNPAGGPWDIAEELNINIGFLFASGPFTLNATKSERFSMAAAYGTDLLDMYTNVKAVQAIYNANYNFATPPPAPTLKAETGDHYVRLTWDDIAENTINPITGTIVFEGYRIYRSTDPDFLDSKVIVSGRGTDVVGNGHPIAQFDLKDGIEGYSQLTIEGIAYYLGSETGITHAYLDTTVTNGQQYYYAVCAYDYGPTINFGTGSYTYYPSENSLAVARSPRGGIILPRNVVQVRPEAKVAGYLAAGASQATHITGVGSGTVTVSVVNSRLVPNNHVFEIVCNGFPDVVHATSYSLIDTTAVPRDTLFTTGRDFSGSGLGITGDGLMPLVQTADTVWIDTINTRFLPGSTTNQVYQVSYDRSGSQSMNAARDAFPNDITITFSNVVVDTAQPPDPLFPGTPAKFNIIAHTPNGDKKLKFIFIDLNGNGTLDYFNNEYVVILTGPDSLTVTQRKTWRITPQPPKGASVVPTLGDVFSIKVNRPLGLGDVYTFVSSAELIQGPKAVSDFKKGPYVVPNPYVGAASFEPAPYLESGRGDRRIEFRGLPQVCTIRIYTVHGDLVQTLDHDNSTDGFVAWNLRTKDNLDVAPGLYIYHVDAPGVGTYIGKFAIIK